MTDQEKPKRPSGRFAIDPKSFPTPREAEAFLHWNKLKAQTGFAPSYRDVSRSMGLSEQGAVKLLKGLERKGLLTPSRMINTQDITATGKTWLDYLTKTR